MRNTPLLIRMRFTFGSVTNSILDSIMIRLELWDFRNASVEHVCKAWRSALKQVWGLPVNCCSAVLCIISRTVPLLDIIYKHFIRYVCEAAFA